MSKWSKLYEELLRNPELRIRFADLEGLLDAFGFAHKRTKGSHRHYRHPNVPTVLTINSDGKSAHRYQVRLLLELVEEYGLHMDP